MTTRELTRREWYDLVCKTQGHRPTDFVLTSNPPLSVCEQCGTRYRYESPTLFESNVPPEESP